jgi:hypothetical protein
MNFLKKLITPVLPDKEAIRYDHSVLTAEQRDLLLSELFAIQRDILSKKGYDYAGEDILSNFRLAGMIVNQGARNPDAVNCLNLISTIARA